MNIYMDLLDLNNAVVFLQLTDSHFCDVFCIFFFFLGSGEYIYRETIQYTQQSKEKYKWMVAETRNSPLLLGVQSWNCIHQHYPQFVRPILYHVFNDNESLHEGFFCGSGRMNMKISTTEYENINTYGIIIMESRVRETKDKAVR